MFPSQRQQDPIHFPHPLSQSTTDPVRKDLPMLFFQTAYFMVAWNDSCITVAFQISSPCSERGAASWRRCIFYAASADVSRRLFPRLHCLLSCSVDKVISGYMWQRFLVEVWFREALLLNLMRASLGVALDWQITSLAAFGRLWV